jgi:hypothetical protein
LKERLQYGDFELWSRFWQFSDLHMLPVPLAAYRCHPQTYTSQQGHKSTEPCTRILEAGGIQKLSRINIRLRNLDADSVIVSPVIWVNQLKFSSLICSPIDGR